MMLRASRVLRYVIIYMRRFRDIFFSTASSHERHLIFFLLFHSVALRCKINPAVQIKLQRGFVKILKQKRNKNVSTILSVIGYDPLARIREIFIGTFRNAENLCAIFKSHSRYRDN